MDFQSPIIASQIKPTNTPNEFRIASCSFTVELAESHNFIHAPRQMNTTIAALHIAASDQRIDS